MQVVRHKAGKHTFEIGTKKGSVLAYREGKVAFDQVLDTDVIWKDLKKGDRASGPELKEAYGTDKATEVAKVILEKGELQLTEKERKEMVTKKRNEIVNYLHKNYIDPKTKLPHPANRFDLALTEMKFRVDPFAPTEKQVLQIMKTLPTILPVKKINP